MRLYPLVAGALALSAPAWAASSSASPPTEGTLTTRDGKDVVPVPLEHTEVAIHVRGYLADVDVEQTFHNPYKTKIEATYLFPLPTNAAVNAMEMVSGGRTIAGQIMLKSDAQATYAVAKQQGRVAALLTEQRPNLFTQTVANIEPGARVVVKLHYVQSLAWQDGGYELVYPMVAGPRYVPKESKLSKDEIAAIQAPVLPAGLRSGHDVAVSVDLEAGMLVGDVASPSHRVAVEGTKVSLDRGDTIPNKDFILRWRVAGEQPSFAVVADRRGDARGSFFLIAAPPAPGARLSITPRELVFVVDTSSSMAGKPLLKAKAMIKRALAGMGPDDTFQIVRFDDSASALGAAPIANKPKNLSYALDWLDKLDAAGGTDMSTGIRASLEFPHDPNRLRLVVFLTDGYIGNEDEVLALVDKERGDARLFAVGIGSAVNRYLVEEMAALGRGAVQVVRPDEDTDKAVAAFYQRIDRPVLTDVRIDWNGLDVADVAPHQVPDLFAGQPLVVSGRYGRPGKATIAISGRSGGRVVSFEVPVDLPDNADRPAVATVWARARIAELSRRQLRGETPEISAEITALALANKLLSPYTAFVAVDRTRVTKAGKLETVPVPVEVPEDVNRDGTGNGGGSIGGGSYSILGHGSGGGGMSSGYGVSGGAAGHIAKIAVVEEAPALTAAPPPVVLREPAAGEYVVAGEDDKIAVGQHRAQVDKCYQSASARIPGVKGRLALHIWIDDHGRVARFEIRDIPGDAELKTCVGDAVTAWHYPVGPAKELDQVIQLGE